MDQPHSFGKDNALSLQNITLRDGAAPARVYIPELLADTVAGKLAAFAVLDLTVDLNGVLKGYAAIGNREAIKVMVNCIKGWTIQYYKCSM